MGAASVRIRPSPVPLQMSLPSRLWCLSRRCATIGGGSLACKLTFMPGLTLILEPHPALRM
jgi:hypothetical protein